MATVQNVLFSRDDVDGLGDLEQLHLALVPVLHCA